MAAAAPADRSLAAPLAALLEAYDKALPASSAETLAKAAEGRGALLQKLEDDATAALADTQLSHTTVMVPQWALTNPDTLPQLDNDELKLLAVEAMIDRAVEHAENLAAGREIHMPGEQLQGAPADLETLLDTPFAWLPDSAMDGNALGAEVDGALVAASMAYWAGEADGVDLDEVQHEAKKNLGAARRQLHEPVWFNTARVAPTVIVKMPKPRAKRPTYFVASCGTRPFFSHNCDWRYDIRTDKVDAVFGGVAAGQSHRGFWQAYSAQRDAVFAGLREQLGMKPERVVFCGHSLGGAVARLLALDWTAQQRAGEGGAEFRARLITFGTPRGGDRAFQAAVAEMLYYKRVRTRWDPVPSWPRDYEPDKASEHWVMYPTRGNAKTQKKERSIGRAAEPRQLLALEEMDLGLVRQRNKHPRFEYANALLRHYRSLGWIPNPAW